MKPISVNFGDVTSGGGFYIEPGTYKAKITGVTQGSGNEYPYLEWTFELFENGHVTLRDRTSLSPTALFRLYGLMEAATGKQIAKTAVTFDPEKLVGSVLVLKVKDREYEGKMYSDVANFISSKAPVARDVTPKAPTVTQPAPASDDDEELPFA